MRKFLMSLALLFTGFGLISARTIKGTVSDPDGELPGANVVIKGTTQGMTTDLDGKYEVEVSDGQTLVFSFVGYATQEIKVSAKTPGVLNISMKTDDKVLDEVVVVGYGVQKKSDLTGSVSGVREDKLKETVAASVDQALQGRVSGVQVTTSSGQPGQAASVRVRGTSTLTGSNEPLYVVDGMPIAQGQQAAGSNPLAAINPADIVSMEVLKDASATAIYGSKAANGVIMVTTRKGKSGESKISYSGQLMISSNPVRLDMMNLQEYAEFWNDSKVITAMGTGGADPLLANPNYLGEGTDWQDEIFRTAIGHQHQLSINGGSENTQYAYSFGYLNQEGIVLNTDYERFNGRVSLENQTKKWLRTGLNLSYTRSNQTKQKGFEGAIQSNELTSLSSGSNFDEQNPVIQSLKQKPLNSPYDADGGFTSVVDQGVTTSIKMNPVQSAMQNPIYLTNNNVQGNAFAQIEFIKGLTWRNEFGMDYTYGEESQYTNTLIANGYNLTKQENKNYFDMWLRDNLYWRAVSTLSYAKRFNDKHSANLMLGAEASESSWHGTNTRKKNYINDEYFQDVDHQNNALGEMSQIDGYRGSLSTISYLGRFNYNYSERYLLTATGRFDGSSTLSEDNHWGFFPSVSLAWRIDQEHFISESNAKDWISNMKLRVGYGETGNAGTRINYLTNYSQLNTADGISYYQAQWVNEDLIWETNWQINAGLDLGFLNNRITGTFDFFLKRNKDLIVTANPGTTLAHNDYRYTSPSDVNVGTIENKGLDLSVNTVNIDTKLIGLPFQWSTDLNMSFVKNEVVDLGGIVLSRGVYTKSDTRYMSRSEEGSAPGLFYGYKVDGVIKNTAQLKEKVRATGTEVGDLNFVDVDGNGTIDANDMTVIGDPNPDFTFGFGNTVRFGNPSTSGVWSLSVFLNGSYGNDVFNLLNMNLEGLDEANINYLSSALDFARVETDVDGSVTGNVGDKYVSNANTDVPRPTTSGSINATVVSDRYVEDGSYLRIQNISLSYSFPKKWTDKMSLSNLSLSANVQNVYTFTNYSGYNPEISNGNALCQGVDTGGYPSPRMFVFGVNVEF